MALAEVRLGAAAGEATIEAHGEFDIANAATLADALREACAAGLDVRLDLADVPFLDVCCLRDVMAARQRLAIRGSRIRIVNAARTVRRLLEAIDAGELLAHDPATTAASDVRGYTEDSAAPIKATDDGDHRLADLKARASDLAVRLPRMRGELAQLAGSVAAVEEQIATTMDSRAQTAPHRAIKLHSVADCARRVAAAERELAARYARLASR